jgi:hypothetical protein
MTSYNAFTEWNSSNPVLADHNVVETPLLTLLGNKKLKACSAAAMTNIVKGMPKDVGVFKGGDESAKIKNIQKYGRIASFLLLLAARDTLGFDPKNLVLPKTEEVKAIINDFTGDDTTDNDLLNKKGNYSLLNIKEKLDSLEKYNPLTTTDLFEGGEILVSSYITKALGRAKQKGYASNNDVTTAAIALESPTFFAKFLLHKGSNTLQSAAKGVPSQGYLFTKQPLIHWSEVVIVKNKKQIKKIEPNQTLINYTTDYLSKFQDYLIEYEVMKNLYNTSISIDFVKNAKNVLVEGRLDKLFNVPGMYFKNCQPTGGFNLPDGNSNIYMTNKRYNLFNNAANNSVLVISEAPPVERESWNIQLPTNDESNWNSNNYISYEAIKEDAKNEDKGVDASGILVSDSSIAIGSFAEPVGNSNKMVKFTIKTDSNEIIICNYHADSGGTTYEHFKDIIMTAVNAGAQFICGDSNITKKKQQKMKQPPKTLYELSTDFALAGGNPTKIQKINKIMKDKGLKLYACPDKIQKTRYLFNMILNNQLTKGGPDKEEDDGMFIIDCSAAKPGENPTLVENPLLMNSSDEAVVYLKGVSGEGAADGGLGGGRRLRRSRRSRRRSGRRTQKRNRSLRKRRSLRRRGRRSRRM